MNTEYFIAKRITTGYTNSSRFSKPIVKIAMLSIALGLAVMIITVAVVTGFQQQIRDKVIGFGGHIQVASFDNNESYAFNPVDKRPPFYQKILTNTAIKHIQAVASKAGILKANGEIQGVVVKGVDTDFDWSFFKESLLAGTILTPDSSGKNKLLISKLIANKLGIKLNDAVPIYFIQKQQQRVRKFTVCGIYDSGMGEQFDDLFVFTNLNIIQKLNDWTPNQVAGFEITVNNFNKVDEIADTVDNEVGYEFKVQTIKESFRQVFSWLAAQDINAVIVISLMILVASINMISALLILILERTNMIGILKALGAGNWTVRKVFLYSAVYLIGKGLFWGNLIAVSFCLLQQRFGFIKLDPESYFISQMPININGIHILLLNIGTLMACVAMLIIPSYIVTRITPVKAIRFN